MRKADLLGIHRELHQIRQALVSAGVVEEAAFNAYDQLGVTPLSLHRDRAAHERALAHLAVSIRRALSVEDPSILRIPLIVQPKEN